MQDPLGDLLGIDGGGAAPGAARLPGPGEARGKAVVVAAHPALDGAVSRDACVAAEVVQRPAARDFAQDPLGELGGVEAGLPLGGAFGSRLLIGLTLSCDRWFDGAGHGGISPVQGLWPQRGRTAALAITRQRMATDGLGPKSFL